MNPLMCREWLTGKLQGGLLSGDRLGVSATCRHVGEVSDVSKWSRYKIMK